MALGAIRLSALAIAVGSLLASGAHAQELEPEIRLVHGASAFDAFWSHLDRVYPYFEHKGIDWKDLGETYKPRAVEAPSLRAYAEALRDMLAELKDSHTSIIVNGERMGTWGREWIANWNHHNWQIHDRADCGEFAAVGRIGEEGFGCLVIRRQSRATNGNVKQTVEALEERFDAPGFLIDLRAGASGGVESFGFELFRIFNGEERVYATHQYRNGPEHDDFGRLRSRVLPAADGVAYTKPIVCLIGPRVMSSGEAFALMVKSLPHATLVGDVTRGSTGNPKRFQLPGVPITVIHSSWLAMDTEGRVIEGNGVAPDVLMALPQEAFAEEDPVWDRGVAILREKCRAAGTLK